jgi:hypothetical protein
MQFSNTTIANTNIRKATGNIRNPRVNVDLFAFFGRIKKVGILDLQKNF